MIEYKYQEEKVVAKFFANLLNDGETLAIFDRGFVSSAEEATHLSRFFWAMVNKSAQGGACLARARRSTGRRNFIAR